MKDSWIGAQGLPATVTTQDQQAVNLIFDYAPDTNEVLICILQGGTETKIHLDYDRFLNFVEHVKGVKNGDV